MKKLLGKLFVFCLILMHVFVPVVSANELNDFAGYYELVDQESILKGILIDDESISLVINHKLYGQTEDDIYLDDIFTWYNRYLNQDTDVYLTEGSEKAPEKFNIVEARFNKFGGPLDFQIAILNPEIVIKDDTLIIKEQKFYVHEFKFGEDAMTDENGNEFKKVDMPE